MTPQPCDRAFEKAEAAFRRAAENLQGAATTCVRQAASDLARACRLFRDQDISQLGVAISENLRGGGNFKNILDACLYLTVRRRGNLGRDPSPEELIVVAALNLEEACQGLLSESVVDVISVGPDTVRSRSASEEVLHVLRARV
jgi:hypothetical protein